MAGRSASRADLAVARAVLRAWGIRAGLALLALGTVTQWFAGGQLLDVPMASQEVRLCVVSGLIVGQGAAIAITSSAVAWAWRARRSVRSIVLGIAVAYTVTTAMVGYVMGEHASTPVGWAWLGMIGLSWWGYAITGDLGSSWLIPVGFVMLSLMVGSATPASVSAWYAPELRWQPVPVVLALFSTGLGGAAVRVGVGQRARRWSLPRPS